VTGRVPFISRPVAELMAYRIGAKDRNWLCVLSGPATGSATTVCLEVWEPGAATPPNSHPTATETFVFLHGSGVATSDGVSAPVQAGQVLVLPAGTVHELANTGQERMYAITVMAPDDGFAALIEGGTPQPLDEQDLAVLGAYLHG
jgi:mannose-6-phosphate isomerase-like protein (cupin superfamily)